MIARITLLIILIISLSGFRVSSQGIRFEESTDLSAALAKAKQENKLVFVDCYAPWCAPCKMMKNEVFTQNEVGEFFNTHFINLQINTDATAYKAIAIKYFISSYPTFLFLDSLGEIIHRAMGGMSADEFLLTGKVAYDSENNFRAIYKKIKNGERTPEILEKYFNFIPYSDEKESLTIEYLDGLNEEQKFTESAWYYFERYVSDISNAPFLCFARNTEKFIEKFGEERVKKKMVDVFQYAYDDNKNLFNALKKTNRKFYTEVERRIKSKQSKL